MCCLFFPPSMEDRADGLCCMHVEFTHWGPHILYGLVALKVSTSRPLIGGSVPGWPVAMCQAGRWQCARLAGVTPS